MKKVTLCVNLFCEDCGMCYEEHPNKRSAMKARSLVCVDCTPKNYNWCEYYRMGE